MKNSDRQENKDKYLDEIGNALSEMVKRCGGDIMDDKRRIPDELAFRQRDLFVHCGIMGLLSGAVTAKDSDTLHVFDRILGYYISTRDKNETTIDYRHYMISSMFATLYKQVADNYHDGERRFAGFSIMFQLSLMLLNKHISIEESTEVLQKCDELVLRGYDRQEEEQKRDAERN